MTAFINWDVVEEEEQARAMEEECYYGLDQCIDHFLRDCCSCLGCEIIAPPKEKGEGK